MPAHLFCNPPPLHEIIESPCRTAPPLPILDAAVCGAFVRDRHNEIVGDVPPLGLYVLEDCFVSHAGALLSPEREVFDAPDLISDYWRSSIAARAQAWKPDDSLGRFIQDPGNVTVRAVDEGDVVSLVKPGYLVYGHWLLDMLPLAWLFRQSSLAREPGPRGVKFLIPRRTPDWARAMLKRLFDLDEPDFLTFADGAETLLVRRLIVPSLMRRSPLLSPMMADFVRDVQRRCGAVAPDPALPRRVFISRRRFIPSGGTSRVSEDADAQEDVARAHGITVVSPEGLAWEQQVRLFTHAELIIGDFGSGLHNAILSGPDAVTLVLGNSRMNWNQSAIAALRGQRLQYLMPVAETVVQGRMTIRHDLDALDRCLLRLVALIDGTDAGQGPADHPAEAGRGITAA